MMNQTADASITTSPAATIAAVDTSAAPAVPDSTVVILPADTSATAILPADSAFVSGTLMSGECSPHKQGRDYPTERCLLADILVIVSLIAFLVTVRKFIEVIPSVFNCLMRHKEALSLEYSSKLSRYRDHVFTALFIPACLIFDWHFPWFPSFMNGLTPTLHIITSFCIMLVYIGLRNLMKSFCKRPKWDKLSVTASNALFRTFFIMTVSICFVTLGILAPFRFSPMTVDLVVFFETAFFFLIFLLRKGQILAHCCSVFSTILYLCALEILPVCALAVPAILL